ncbi:aryldialkylphosphatase [Hypoxylon sp. NC1633]|nr:aryldialkylphosphatase [Hypoxylon sp. NC1633]
MHQEVENVGWMRTQALQDPDSADFKTCSAAATTKGGWPSAVVLALDKSEKMHEDGNGLYVKPVLQSLGLQKAIVEAAHQHGFLAVAHSLSLQGTIDILRTGVDGMTHTSCDNPPNQELIDAYLMNNAHCNSTLATIGILTTEGQKEQDAYARDSRVQKLFSAEDIKALCACMELGKGRSSVEYTYQNVWELKAAGINIILGSDSAGPALGTAYGLTALHELALLVNKCGFTPREALRPGTLLVARRLRFND